MERIKGLTRYQKGVLIFMATMTLVFAVIYSMTISRVGYEYMDTVLISSRENDSTVYTGKIKGQQAQFTVSADKTVVFQYGDKTYGPYIAKVDPTAVPKDEDMAEHMTGVELRKGEEILFRGGIWEEGDYLWLFNEDGTANNMWVSLENGRGIWAVEHRNTTDPMEPPVYAILDLMDAPKLTHKGNWLAWFGAVFIYVLNALDILFADELFRWRLSFQIRNADRAEPSDWELAVRHIGWAAIGIMTLLIFIIGLK